MEKREAWVVKTASMDHRKLVFIDESGAKTNMTRLYGRAGIGQRARDSAPTATWRTTTMVAAISVVGVGAPFLLSGAIDGEAFAVYAERVLAPELGPGDVVVMDNLSSHKNTRARAALELAGARVVDLPPYSPDFNPIEKMWSKIKALLRGAKARTFDELTEAVRAAIAAVTHQDIVGWFHSCGYTII